MQVCRAPIALAHLHRGDIRTKQNATPKAATRRDGGVTIDKSELSFLFS
jgi:hypothetical protein